MDGEGSDLITIYKLIDPQNDSVKYIGQTHNSLKRRLSDHLSDARRGMKNHRCNWIRKLLSEGIFPSVEVIEIVNWDSGNERERHWIAQYGRKNLVNGTDGGEGTIGLVISDETRNKQSLAHIGKPTWNKGISTSTEHLKEFQFKKGFIPHNKGMSWPIETKTKVSNSKNGKSTGRKITTKGACFGATYFKEDAVWISQIRFMKKSCFIIRCKLEKDAGIAYDICSLWFSKENRKLNFPDKKDEYLFLLSNKKIENMKELRKEIKNYIENGGIKI